MNRRGFFAVPLVMIPIGALAVPATGIVVNITVHGHVLNTQQFTDTVMIPALRDVIGQYS